jgi:hypothetical protein
LTWTFSISVKFGLLKWFSTFGFSQNDKLL